MIKLFNFGSYQQLADPSPFCLKVDLYMRIANIEFETESGAQHLGKSPKGKLPFIVDDGNAIGDSMFIFDYLKEKYGETLDKELNAEQKAVARAFIKMMDENFYWCMVYSRWIKDDTWPHIKQEFFGKMPAPMKYFVPAMLRKGVRKTLHSQGLGRHSDAEILEIARKDLTALSDYLGTKDYFLINKPTTLDVTAYAFLAEMILPDVDNELGRTARSFENLVNFVNRIHEQYYQSSNNNR